MAKTAAEFLSDLAQRELVSPNVLASLRRQVAKAAKPVSATAVARLLVDKGHLTAAQAERLLGTALGPAPQGSSASGSSIFPSGTAAKRPAPPPLAETKPLDSELGLAPLEDISSHATKTPPPASSTGSSLEPLDLELLDLVPLDDVPKSAAPKSHAAAGQPAPATPAQRLSPPVQKPGPPSSKPPVAASAPIGASSPLVPLEPLPLSPSPLEPLDALAPLSLPLTPIPQPVKARSQTAAARPAPLEVPAPSPPKPAVQKPLAPVPPAPLAPLAPAAARAQPAGSWRAVWWIGGIVAGLFVLAGAGGGLAWLLSSRGGATDPFDLAEQDYKAGQFAGAVEKYAALLEADPHHAQAGLARVRRGIAKMLAAKASGDNWPAVLPIAREALTEIDREPDLAQVHAELAPLLMEMADGLIKRAQAAAADDVAARLADARDALALADNGRYVPGTLRDWQRLAEIAEALAVLERNQASEQALGEYMTAADKSVEAGELTKAFAEWDKLLADYPELAGDAKLHELGEKAAKIAAAAVKPVSELSKAETSEAASSIVASITLVHRPALTSPGPAGTYLARAGGSVWALDTANGKILWRQHLGRGTAIEPVPLSADDTSDVLLVDARRHEVLRVARKTGALRWRHAFDSPLEGPPLVAANRIFVTSRAGRVTALDPQSGDAVAACRLPFPARLAPVADAAGTRLYQLAKRHYLFVLSTDDLKCERVVFCGHEAHSVEVPPIVLTGRLIVAQSQGIDGTMLHVLPLDDVGLPSGKESKLELSGQVVMPPVVLQNRLFVFTDRGATLAFEIPTDMAAPLKKVGETPAEAATSLRFGLVAGNGLCIADEILRQFEFMPADGSLNAKWTSFAGDVFESPPQLLGDTVLCVRHSPGHSGWIAAAVKGADGKPLWETPLAAPLVELSVVDGKSIHVVSSLAAEGTIDPADLQGESLRELADVRGLPTLSLPDVLAGTPIRTADGYLAPCASGCVYWLNAEGKPAAGPLQMRMEAGERLTQCSAVPIGNGGDQFVISDGKQSLYYLALKQEPQPQLVSLGSARLDEPLISPVAALGEHVYVVDRAGSLRSFKLPDLTPARSQPLAARAILSGPYAIADALLLATDRQELVCVSGDCSVRWKVPLIDGLLVGSPVMSADSLLVATQNGFLLRLAPDSGRELARVDVGQPLSGAPVAIGDFVLAATAGGTVLKLSLFEKEEAP